MPLSSFENGAFVKVVRVGGSEETHKHLEELGFVPGAEVKVVSKVCGNMILQVMDSRIALDGKLANKIMVMPGVSGSFQVKKENKRRLKNGKIA